MGRKSSIALIISASLLLSGCSSFDAVSTTYNGKTAYVSRDSSDAKADDASVPESSVPSFPELTGLSSPDLNNGVWDVSISGTGKGENKNPALSWNPVEGASEYVVYMVDTSTANLIHLRTGGIKKPLLEKGVLKSREYKGLTPAKGVHTYDVYVYAMRSDPGKLPGIMFMANLDFASVEKKLDNAGTILAKGKLTGTFAVGA